MSKILRISHLQQPNYTQALTLSPARQPLYSSQSQPIKGSHLALIPQPPNCPKPSLDSYTAQVYTPSSSSDQPAELPRPSASLVLPTYNPSTLTDILKLAQKLRNTQQYTHKCRKEGNRHIERILWLLLRLLVVTT